MLSHEFFEEICAAASIGQATPEDLVKFEEHAAECPSCRQAYADYLLLAAQQFAASRTSPVSAENAGDLDSGRFAEEFFEHAAREGIAVSPEASRDAGAVTREAVGWPRKPGRRSRWWLASTAAAALVIAGLSVGAGYYYGRVSSRSITLEPPKYVFTPPIITRAENGQAAIKQQVAEIEARNTDLEARSKHLAEEVQQATDAIRAKDVSLMAGADQERRLAASRDALQAELKDVQRQLTESSSVAASAQQEIARLRSDARDVSATLAFSRSRINELSEQLQSKSAAFEQARQLLALGHDVSDLMGARNLHIVDVVDTDSHGKMRPAFGRIFFTEGKSLLFYAYDLNETRIEKAAYQYRVWAQKEGSDRQVKALGIFYSDDKAQRRWVYKCDDPNILREIDSVFVTLEPAGADPSHPKGPNLMYAYLRGQPNHQ